MTRCQNDSGLVLHTAPSHVIPVRHEQIIEPAFDKRGILHLHLHERHQVLPDTRRRHQEMRGNLADVFLHRLRPLRTVDAKTHDQRCCQRPEGVTNPGRRQIGQCFIRAPIGLNLQHPLDGRNEVVV